MLKTRIEVNELGEFIITLPEEVVDHYGFDAGDELDLDIDDSEYLIVSHA